MPVETYSRIGLLRSYRNLQSYWTTKKLWKLTVVLDYYEAMETYSRIGDEPCNQHERDPLLAWEMLADVLTSVVLRNNSRVNYTPNEWKRLEITLETSRKDWKLHSNRVEKIGSHINRDTRGYFVVLRQNCCFWRSEIFHTGCKLHSKWVEKRKKYTRNEWRR